MNKEITDLYIAFNKITHNESEIKELDYANGALFDKARTIMKNMRNTSNDPFCGISDSDIELALDFVSMTIADYEVVDRSRNAYKKVKAKLYETLLGIQPGDADSKAITAIRKTCGLYKVELEYHGNSSSVSYFMITFPDPDMAFNVDLIKGFSLLERAQPDPGEWEVVKSLYETLDLEEMRKFISVHLDNNKKMK